MRTSRPTIYNSNQLDEISNEVHHRGYAVVKIDSIDLSHLKMTFLQDLTQITGHAIPLWTSDKFPKPAMKGLMGEYGLSQGDAAWQVRTNPAIQQIFGKLQKTDNLVCSMDAVGYSSDYEKQTGQKWLHVDQNPHINGGQISSFQGIFYAEDSYGDRAGTVVVPQSHLDKLKHDYKSRGHFQIVDQNAYWRDAVKLEIPAGCLLVYTSWLVHQGWHGPHRLCFMVSYGRKIDRTEDSRRAKVMMYLGGHRSTHWSQFAQYHGYKFLPDQKWQLLHPRLSGPGTNEYASKLVCMSYTAPELYEKNLDTLIPPERLTLL